MLDLAGTHWKMTGTRAADISFEEATAMIAWQKKTEEYTWKKTNALRKGKLSDWRDPIHIDIKGLFTSFWHFPEMASANQSVT